MHSTLLLPLILLTLLYRFGKETKRSVEEHQCPKPLETIHKGTQEGKSKENLALREENSQGNSGDDYGSLSSTETSLPIH